MPSALKIRNQYKLQSWHAFGIILELCQYYNGTTSKLDRIYVYNNPDLFEFGMEEKGIALLAERLFHLT